MRAFVSHYIQKTREFSRNANLYVVHVIGMDMIHGSFNVLFNLYLLAIGFGIQFIGLRLMITVYRHGGHGGARRAGLGPHRPEGVVHPGRWHRRRAGPDHDPHPGARRYFSRCLLWAPSSATSTTRPRGAFHDGEQQAFGAGPPVLGGRQLPYVLGYVGGSDGGATAGPVHRRHRQGRRVTAMPPTRGCRCGFCH